VNSEQSIEWPEVVLNISDKPPCNERIHSHPLIASENKFHT